MYEKAFLARNVQQGVFVAINFFLFFSEFLQFLVYVAVAANRGIAQFRTLSYKKN